MTRAAAHIRRLDAALRREGEAIALRKVTGVENQAATDVGLLAIVKPGAPVPLSGGNVVAQETFTVITSPTQITRAQWPGGVRPDFTADTRIPELGYKVVLRGRVRQIERVVTLMPGGEFARLELHCRG